MKTISNERFEAALLECEAADGSARWTTRNDAAVFAQVLHQLGVKTMTPHFGWTAGKTGDLSHLQVHLTSFLFSPYVGVEARRDGFPETPLPWKLARHFDVLYCGGASKEEDYMQMCFSSGSNNRSNEGNNVLYPPHALQGMAERFASRLYMTFQLLQSPKMADLLKENKKEKAQSA